ncbi:MAG: hypothetical protein SFV22_15380 [Saprospiraceae bacterium]|nr:hypothetical protein [Saprospiraceae bacterium]
MNTWQDSDLLPCQTDDCLRFFNDGTYFSHTNGTPCNFLMPSQFTGEWHFTNNQTSMVIAAPHFGTGTIGIIELSPSRFITQETLLTIPYLVMNRNTHEPR